MKTQKNINDEAQARSTSDVTGECSTWNNTLSIKEIETAMLAALRKVDVYKMSYTTPVTMFHLVWCGDDVYAGVFGDGANGCYEWCIARDGKLFEWSDVGYGSVAIALKDVINHDNLKNLLS